MQLGSGVKNSSKEMIYKQLLVCFRKNSQTTLAVSSKSKARSKTPVFFYDRIHLIGEIIFDQRYLNVQYVTLMA